MFPFPGDLPDSGIEPAVPALQADSLPLSHLESPNMMLYITYTEFFLIKKEQYYYPHTIRFLLLTLIHPAGES